MDGACEKGVTKSARGAGNLTFGIEVVLDGEVQKFRNGARDLDLELEMRSKC